MMRGTVVGSVWAARHAPGLDGQKLLLVAAKDAEGRHTGRLVVATDVLDARAGAPRQTITSSPTPASSVSAQTTRSSVGSEAAAPAAPGAATAAPGGRSPRRYGRTSSSFTPWACGHFTVDHTVPATRPRNI